MSERRLRIDAENLDTYDLLYESGSHIPPTKCEARFLYLVRSRSIGELAVCQYPDINGVVTFSGWRHKLGRDFISSEIHFDCDESFGTVQPILKLSAAPNYDDNKLLGWLLEQYIDLQRTKVNWLLGMPQILKKSGIFPKVLSGEREKLADYLLVKKEGFNAHLMPTFSEIINKST